MLPTSYIAAGERTSPLWAAAFAAGSGGGTQDGGPLQPGPAAMFGSAKIWGMLQQAVVSGRDWYYGDHAYFRRFEFYRCTRGAFQHAGEGNAGPARFRRLGVEIEPWRRRGRHVLICPPDHGFAALMGFDAGCWLEDVTRAIKLNTDRRIVVRGRLAPHKTALESDLRGCFALVTFMSNAAVEALLAGVPVVCTGPCAARSMGISDPAKIEGVIRPGGRRQWAYNLAANQWTLEEMAAGMLWREIGR